MALTDVVLRKAKPTAKPYKLTDAEGMYLDVRPNGSKYWRLKYRYLGKQKLLALRVFPKQGSKVWPNIARYATLPAQKNLS